MMVFTGLWDPKKGLVRKGNEEELAAVLSHEMAHANARHVTEMVSRGMTIGLIGTAAQAAIYHGAGSTAAGAFGQAANLGFNIYFPMYSRGNETEADKVGLMYMAKAGYDPRVAVRLWERAAHSKNRKPYTIFASHPQSGQRAATLRRMLPKVMPVYEANKKKYEKSRKRRRKK
jgi:predicted Zn-dependent protease